MFSPRHLSPFRSKQKKPHLSPFRGPLKKYWGSLHEEEQLKNRRQQKQMNLLSVEINQAVPSNLKPTRRYWFLNPHPHLQLQQSQSQSLYSDSDPGDCLLLLSVYGRGAVVCSACCRSFVCHCCLPLKSAFVCQVKMPGAPSDSGSEGVGVSGLEFQFGRSRASSSGSCPTSDLHNKFTLTPRRTLFITFTLKMDMYRHA